MSFSGDSVLLRHAEPLPVKYAMRFFIPMDARVFWIRAKHI